MDQHAFRQLVSARQDVPLNGLDFTLLAENKAKLAQDDADLEQAFEQSRHEASPGPERSQAVDALDPRGQQTAVGLGKGFRPIGSKPETVTDEGEYKWVNGKRMRKKKKPAAGEPPLPPPRAPAKPQAEARQPSAKTSTHKSLRTQPVKTPEAVSQAQTREPEPPMRVTPPQAEASDDDEDDDIFAGVGGWAGLPDADEDDGEDKLPTEEVVDAAPPALTEQSPTIEAEASTPPASAPDAPISAAEPLPAPPTEPALPEPIAPPPPPKKAGRSKWEDSDDEAQFDKKRKKKKSARK